MRVHLTKTFVALNLELLVALGNPVAFLEALHLIVVPAIFRSITFRALVERRSGDVDISVLDERTHTAEEERHEECSNVSTIDIGIGHDNHLVIAEFAQIGSLAILGSTDSNTEGTEDIGDFLALEHLVVHSLLHVEDFTAERKDSLILWVTALLSRTAGRITLDEEQFAVFGIAGGTVGEFARETATGEHRFALHFHAGIVCGMASLSCENHLLHDSLSLAWVLLEISAESLAHGSLHSTNHLVVTEFCLGLSLELRFEHLHRNHSGETLAEVIARNLHFSLLKHFVVLGILFEGACEAAAETGEVSTTFDSVDIVDKRVDILVESGVVGHCHLNRDTGAGFADVDNIFDEVFLVGVDILDKFIETGFGIESFGLGIAVFVEVALVGEHQSDTGVKESEVAKTSGKDRIFIGSNRENRGIGMESNHRTGAVGFADNSDRGFGVSARILLHIHLAIAAHLGAEIGRKGVDTRHTHTV